MWARTSSRLHWKTLKTFPLFFLSEIKKKTKSVFNLEKQMFEFQIMKSCLHFI